MGKYFIRDWARNTRFNGQEFDSIDDAEIFLQSKLNESNCSEDRDEFYIVQLPF